jgi:hypothetical protein
MKIAMHAAERTSSDKKNKIFPNYERRLLKDKTHRRQ